MEKSEVSVRLKLGLARLREIVKNNLPIEPFCLPVKSEREQKKTKENSEVS